MKQSGLEGPRKVEAESVEGEDMLPSRIPMTTAPLVLAGLTATPTYLALEYPKTNLQLH